MERYSIALHGIDSYTKQPMYLPYKLDAASVRPHSMKQGCAQ